MLTYYRLPLELATVKDITDELNKRPLRYVLIEVPNLDNKPYVTSQQFHNGHIATNMTLADCEATLGLTAKWLETL